MAIPVLHLVTTRIRGGMEEHVLLLLSGLDRSRFRPVLACPPELAEKFGSDLPSDVPHVPLRMNGPQDALQLACTLRRLRIEVLHSHLFQASRLASPIGVLCRVPAIVETPHMREGWRQGLVRGSYAADRLCARFVHRFIAVSEANARYLIEEKRLPRPKVQVISNSCSFKRIDPGRPRPMALKQALGFGDDDPVLLVLARLEAQKGHAVLLNSLMAIRQEFPTVRLVCAGEGSLRAALEARSQAMGLSDAVRFVGYQASIADWLALADVSVLPSLFEGLPLAAIESLAAQKPMVATSVDGTPEVVVHEKTGLTVPPGESGPLADAIRRLLREPQLAGRLAGDGRRWVEDRFSEERQVRLTGELYLSCLGRV